MRRYFRISSTSPSGIPAESAGPFQPHPRAALKHLVIRAHAAELCKHDSRVGQCQILLRPSGWLRNPSLDYMGRRGGQFAHPVDDAAAAAEAAARPYNNSTSR